MDEKSVSRPAGVTDSNPAEHRRENGVGVVLRSYRYNYLPGRSYGYMNITAAIKRTRDKSFEWTK